jgi:hypothetical protein
MRPGLIARERPPLEILMHKKELGRRHARTPRI